MAMHAVAAYPCTTLSPFFTQSRKSGPGLAPLNRTDKCGRRTAS